MPNPIWLPSVIPPAASLEDFALVEPVCLGLAPAVPDTAWFLAQTSPAACPGDFALWAPDSAPPCLWLVPVVPDTA